MTDATARPEQCDLLVRNAYVLTMDAKRQIFAKGAIAVRDGDILAVGRDADLASRYTAAETLDAGGAVVHPGFIDGHYHLTIHLARGTVPDDPAMKSPFGYGDWMNLVGEEDEHLQTQVTAIEMLRKGYTFFLEPGTVLWPDAAAAAVESVGVRGSLADPYLWDVPDGGNVLADKIAAAPCTRERALKLLGGQLARNRNRRSLVRGHVAIYGSGSQSEELMRAAKTCAEENGVVMTMHHNFTPVQAAKDDARFGGQHSIKAFAEKGLLGRCCSFVHMNVIRDDEMDPIVESGMSLVWQPGNYMFYGIAAKTESRMAELIQRGANVTFGVDTAKVWTFGDLELIGYLVARQAGRYISPAKILEMRTCDAARAVGLEDAIGALAPGMRADIVIRDLARPESAPGVNAVQELLLGGQSGTVATVIVDGQVVYRDGAVQRVDAAAVVAKGREAAKRVLGRAGFTPSSTWPVVT